MSIAGQAETTAIRAADSSLLAALTRAGFLGYGLTHLLVAWLALRIATGEPAPEGDQSGALMTFVREPGGRILVTAVCVGLAAMALWQTPRALAAQRYGGPLLAIAGLGVAALAAFCLIQAPYRQI